MRSDPELISSIAQLTAALAWPLMALIALLMFRSEFRAIFTAAAALTKRLKSMEGYGFRGELESVAEQADQQSPAVAARISIGQIRASERVKAEADAIGEVALLRQLDRLCGEYDLTRRKSPPSLERTRAMTRIIVQMRTLGPSLSQHIDVYKSSGSPGSRLAAVAMMQMEPRKLDLSWLVDRFRVDKPFIFYHAALALQNAANEATPANSAGLYEAAKEAMTIVEDFDGEPDEETLEVLAAIIA